MANAELLQQNTYNTNTPDLDEFEALLEQSNSLSNEGRVVSGTVLAIEKDLVIVDVGLKSEGVIPLAEFALSEEEKANFAPGKTVDVYIQRFEGRDGRIVLSREKAKREEAWKALEEKFNNSEQVTGEIFARVKGGFTVNVSGILAFLPGSQVDIRPIRDVAPLMNIPQPFLILKMDRARGNIVLSRRAVLEENRAEMRGEIIAQLEEGQILEGDVKNITGYGAFIDLGGVDGLLHVTDITWGRIAHPTEVLSVGKRIKVKIIKFNKEQQRISLGMKQLTPDPWDAVVEKYAPGSKLKAKVSNITEFGLFVAMTEDIDGLVHLSDLNWNLPGDQAIKEYKKGDMVKCQVLDVDPDRSRVALGIKQLGTDSVGEALSSLQVGKAEKIKVVSVEDSGYVVELADNADVRGFMRRSDASDHPLAENEVVVAKVLSIDTKSRKVFFSVKAVEMEEQKSALKELASSNTQATLGDILGAALQSKKDD